MPILNTLRHAPSAPSANKRVHLSAHVLCTPYFNYVKSVCTLHFFCIFCIDNQELKQCIHIYTPSALASARTLFPCHHLRSNTLLAHPFIRSQTETRTGIGGEIFQTEQESFLTPVTVFSPSHNNACGYSAPISPCLHKGSHQSADSVYTPNYLIFIALQTIVQSVDKIAFFLCIARTLQ